MRETPETRIRLVVFDWAGTLIDHGSLAPLAAMTEAFESMAVPVTPAQVRWAMTGRKREQIESLLRVPAVLRAFERAHGRGPTSYDVDALHAAYMPAQLAAIRDRAGLIEGAANSVVHVHERGLAVGTITDYGKAGHGLVLEYARRQGLVPDYAACTNDAAVGGAEPFLILACMEALHVVRPREVLFVGDSLRDMEAGRHVGCTRVGVASTGDEVGLDRGAWSKLALGEQNAYLAHAHRNLRDAGADFVIDSLHELPLVLERIAERGLSSAA